MNDTDYTLLATKLHIPEPRRKLVPRTALIERLNNGIRRKLTLISAPAGFGKTTLLSEWISQVQKPVAWISLDSSDNDPVRFLTYLITGFQKIQSTIGHSASAMIQTPQDPPIESALISLINDINAYQKDIYFALDDYHAIENSQIDHIVEILIDHSPDHMHWAIATRSDPILPLARLRGRRQINEIRSADLAFNTCEVASMLKGVFKEEVAKENVDLITKRTEGWITGLHLAILSMQKYQNLNHFILEFKGNDRYIADYFMEEILTRLPEAVKAFLLKTAALEQFCGPLCEAVTGNSDSQNILVDLERTNIFVIPLDDRRIWYRYHHLFRELLVLRMAANTTLDQKELHSNASEWYANNGFIESAIDHAMAAGDVKKVGKLLSDNVENLLLRGERVNLEAWLNALPNEILVTHTSLGVSLAWLQFSAGKLDEAERSLEFAEKAALPTNKREIGKIAAVRAWVSTFRGNLDQLGHHATQAMKNLPDDENKWRGLAALAAGYGYYLRGDMPAAEKNYGQAVQFNLACDNVYFSIIARVDRALALARCGDLNKALDEFQTSYQTAKRNGIENTELTGWLLASWGEVLAERNDMASALKYMQDGILLADRPGSQTAMLSWAFMAALGVIFYSKDMDAAKSWIPKVDHIQQSVAIPGWINCLLEASKGRIYLMSGSLKQIETWIAERGISAEDELNYLREGQYIVLARYLIQQDQDEKASHLLDRLIEFAKYGGRTAIVIELLILKARLLSKTGDSMLAIDCLTKALALAEPGGFIQIFVVEGEPIAVLLEKMLDAKADIPQAFLKKLLTEFKLRRIVKHQDGLPEPLSERELEVLRFIAAGLSNKKISEELFISLSTVKTHLRNIYGKLDVHSRTEAVAKAKGLGILNS